MQALPVGGLALPGAGADSVVRAGRVARAGRGAGEVRTVRTGVAAGREGDRRPGVAPPEGRGPDGAGDGFSDTPTAVGETVGETVGGTGGETDGGAATATTGASGASSRIALRNTSRTPSQDTPTATAVAPHQAIT